MIRNNDHPSQKNKEMALTLSMHWNLLFFTVIFLNVTGWSQMDANLRSDRPGQAMSPNTVGEKVIQLQAGVDQSKTSISNYFVTRTFQPDVVLRVGLTDRFEVNTFWSYQWSRWTGGYSIQFDYLNNGIVSVRYNILSAQNYRPAIGLQCGVRLPLKYTYANGVKIAPIVNLSIAQKLTNKFKLTVNTGVVYSGISPDPRGSYVINLGYSLSDSWSLFVENYGSWRRNDFENYWDGGAAFLLNPNWQFDLYGGYGKVETMTSFFGNVGFTWRLPYGHLN
jgi:hypothetical protein